MECAFGINSEDEFELEMLKRLNSYKEFEKEKEKQKEKQKETEQTNQTNNLGGFLVF